MREVPPMVDQPMPGDEPELTGEACCLELYAPGGQLIAMLLMQRVPVEDVALRVIPGFRAQSGLRGPVGFKMRALTADEQAAVHAMQQGQS
jgi:hypothetical protein